MLSHTLHRNAKICLQLRILLSFLHIFFLRLALENSSFNNIGNRWICCSRLKLPMFSNRLQGFSVADQFNSRLFLFERFNVKLFLCFILRVWIDRYDNQKWNLLLYQFVWFHGAQMEFWCKVEGQVSNIYIQFWIYQLVISYPSHGWITSWLQFFLFPLVVELNLVKFRQRFDCLLWGKRLTLD